MNTKRNTTLAWLFFGLIAVTFTLSTVFYLIIKSAEDNLSLDALLLPIIPLTFSLIGALIILRQPRNAVGWLMTLIGISVSLTLPVNAYLEPFLTESFIPPQSPEPILLFTLWFNSWSWLLYFPIIFIMVLFPTGRPINQRWEWLIYFGLGWAGVIILATTFSKTLSPSIEGIDWTVRNPIGFLEGGEWENVIAPVFILSLFIWVILCVVSLFVRFHNARGVEREQIKWLFFACTVFAVGFVTALIMDPTGADNFWSLLLPFLALTIPVSIAIAILRYQLYDIDIIIWRTLQYTLLTGLLVMVCFGSVVLLQSLVENITGGQSPIVISTLAIAALFNPLRIRTQDFIDRRFFRTRYDAEQTLARFAIVARDEVDMDKLTTALLGVVEESMQPERVSVWLRGPEVRS